MQVSTFTYLLRCCWDHRCAAACHFLQSEDSCCPGRRGRSIPRGKASFRNIPTHPIQINTHRICPETIRFIRMLFEYADTALTWVKLTVLTICLCASVRTSSPLTASHTFLKTQKLSFNRQFCRCSDLHSKILTWHFGFCSHFSQAKWFEIFMHKRFCGVATSLSLIKLCSLWVLQVLFLQSLTSLIMAGNRYWSIV